MKINLKKHEKIYETEWISVKISSPAAWPAASLLAVGDGPSVHLIQPRTNTTNVNIVWGKTCPRNLRAPKSVIQQSGSTGYCGLHGRKVSLHPPLTALRNAFVRKGISRPRGRYPHCTDCFQNTIRIPIRCVGN